VSRSLHVVEQSEPWREKLCITEGHQDKPVEARGLCHACYTAARKRVVLGKTSWESLERRGMALPLGQSGVPKKGTSKWDD